MSTWTGRPAEKPALAVGPNKSGGRTVYASWNGSTEVERWEVLADSSRSSLVPVARAHRSGFEAVVNSDGPYFAVLALGGDGRGLAQSDPVREEAVEGQASSRDVT